MSGALPGQARDALYSIDPNQPADQFRTLDQVRLQSVEAPRLTATLMGLFAGLALAITAAGLGGVIAFSVNQRTQEFGVRMALGASRSSLLRMVLNQALKLSESDSSSAASPPSRQGASCRRCSSTSRRPMR